MQISLLSTDMLLQVQVGGQQKPIVHIVPLKVAFPSPLITASLLVCLKVRRESVTEMNLALALALALAATVSLRGRFLSHLHVIKLRHPSLLCHYLVGPST